MYHIVFVGLSGIARRTRACDVRLAFMANMLAKSYDITLLSRYACKQKLVDTNVTLDERIVQKDIIRSRKTGGVVSTLLFGFSFFIELFALLSLNRKKRINALYVYSGHYTDFLLYRIVSRLVGAKVVYDYVEYKSILETKSLYAKINNKLVDFKGAKLWDGVLPISEFLKEKALEVNPNLICQKVTPLCDFCLYEMINKGTAPTEKYILYCGSIGYQDVAELIADAYSKSRLSENYKLIMVLSGNKNAISSFSNIYPNVSVVSALPYNDLIAYYKKAEALLIPLRNNIRDTARFPNKICEYLAARGIIITTNVGEIPYYFKDGVNAIVAESYGIKELVKVFDNLAWGEYNLDMMHKNAYETGLKYFDSVSYEQPMKVFFNKLING